MVATILSFVLMQKTWSKHFSLCFILKFSNRITDDPICAIRIRFLTKTYSTVWSGFKKSHIKWHSVFKIKVRAESQIILIQIQKKNSLCLYPKTAEKLFEYLNHIKFTWLFGIWPWSKTAQIPRCVLGAGADPPTSN